MKIHLISTTDLGSDRREVLQRMLNSVEESATALSGCSVQLHILLQRSRAGDLPSIEASLPSFARSRSIESLVSLSKARNILLEPLLQSGVIGADDLVAFPDDDGWYPKGFLAGVLQAFKSDAGLGFFFCRYGTAPVDGAEEVAKGRPAAVPDVVRNASSNTIVLRGLIANSIGLFDEGLGLGTPNGGAEDLDYALRAYLAARVSRYAPQTLVGHRDKSPQFRAKYYRGSLIALRRYAGRRPGLALEYIRKLAVGLYLCVKRELDVSAYLLAVRAGSCA